MSENQQTEPAADLANSPDLEQKKGLLAALGAFGLWGVFPLYFKAIGHIPVFEVLANRIVWSLVLVFLLVVITKRFGHLKAAISDRKTFLLFLGSTSFIALNWTTFVWAIANDRVLEAGLGYYINPLVNVGLGMLFFQEKLNRWQTTAIFLAICAVALMTYIMGHLPWVSLVLGFSFGFYGLFRKKAQTESTVGLMVETAILTPFCLAYLVFLVMTTGLQDGQVAGGFYSMPDFLLLVGTGVVTGVPLILFSYGAQRLRLSTVGVMQYIAPTMHVVLAIFIFNEAFSHLQFVAFALIWIGLIIYTIDGIRQR
ncbi:EamA family transporter RarD [Sneathiella glossodoripedis]|uniref:EamA family transporter RarD n=1 Tax=Sneathiella glossodoripedis TaxID=418853 RepID=UPI0004709796|nr:EamA family transporter RarD [Sneathiella glossodoripedis]